MININKFKSKTLSFILSTTILGTMVGCSSRNIEDRLTKEGISVELLSDDIYKMNSFNQTTIDKFDARYIEINNSPEEDYKILCTPSEFSQYTNEYNITYDDIRNTINSIDIDLNIKNLLLEGINNIENNNFNMDLSVLNYNLKHLKIKYEDEMIDGIEQAYAKFEPKDSTIVISSTAFDSEDFVNTFYHEVFGHGMTIAYIEDKEVLCSTCLTTCIINDNKYKGNYVLGRALDEGLAEIIRKYASNKRIDNDDSFYCPDIYSLLILLKSNNISVSDYANNGVEYLINKLNINNLGSQINYIECLDKKLLYIVYQNEDIDEKLEDLVTNYLFNYIENELKKGKDTTTIDIEVNNIINSYTNYLIPYPMGELSIISMQTETVGDYIAIENIQYYKDEYLNQYKGKRF